MVLIICTKNELNLTNRYWDMVPDGQTNGWTEWTDVQTDRLTHWRRQNYIPPTSSGDKNTGDLFFDEESIYENSKTLTLIFFEQTHGQAQSNICPLGA